MRPNASSGAAHSLRSIASTSTVKQQLSASSTQSKGTPSVGGDRQNSVTSAFTFGSPSLPDSRSKQQASLGNETDSDDDGAGGVRSIRPDEYFAMGKLEQLEHLHEKIDASLKKKRLNAIDPEHRIDYTSNYKTLLEMIAMPSGASASGGTNGTGGKGAGGSGSTRPLGGEPKSLGPILTALRREEREARLVAQGGGASDGGHGGGGGGGKRGAIRNAVQVAKKMSIFARRGTAMPASLAQVAADDQRGRAPSVVVASPPDPLRAAPPHIADAARSTLATQTRQEMLEAIQQRNDRLRSLDKSCRDAMTELRPALLRRPSYPPMIGHVGVLREAHDELQVVIKENEELVKINQGKEPREEELKLRGKVAALEEQIGNQLALIKGLREKVRILSAGGGGGVGSQYNSFYNGGGVNSDGASVPASPVKVNSGGGGGSGTNSLTSTLRSRGNLLGAPSNSAAPSGDVLPPRGELVTIVVTDVQSSAYLWECQPTLMKTQSALYSSLMREQAVIERGYEVANVGDRHMFAFQTPADACRWALTVQVKLCQLPWDPELNENADTPAELLPGSTTEYLWRGLRVRMGIDVRASAQSDPLSSRTVYEGDAVERASYLEQLALGGEILITGAVNDYACASLSALGTPLVQPWGSLGVAHRGTAVFRLIPQKLQERIHGFQRELGPCEQAVAEAAELAGAHPPQGRVTIVTVLMGDVAALRENTTETVQSALFAAYNDVIIRELRNYHGYLTMHNSTQSVIAFGDDVAAAQFALTLQESLLEVEWAPEVLNIPQFAAVRVKGALIYAGPRTQIGLHVLETSKQYQDPLTNLTQFRAPDAKYSSLLALRAIPGEILITEKLLDAVTRNTEQLRLPVVSFAIEVSVPTGDSLVRAFQICPLSLKPRIAYCTRDMRLPDEPPDTHLEAVRALERQVETLQSKIADKERWIERLEEQLVEKNRVIGSIRTSVLGLPFTEVVVREVLRGIDSGFAPRGSVCLVAIGFAHAEDLFDKWADDILPAIDTWNQLLDSMALANHGTELRRLASNSERIFAFTDACRAADFWLSVCRNSLFCDWPEKLEDSEEAGAVMASELIPGIHPTQETLVWKGLRPKAAMEIGTPHFVFNTAAACYESIGDDINAVTVMLRHAHEGDCVLAPELAEELRAKQDRITEPLITDYGYYGRLQAGEMKMRNRIMKQVFYQDRLVSTATARHEAALLVHVTMWSCGLFASLAADFEKDVKLFEAKLIQLVAAHRGVLIRAAGPEFSLAFTDVAAGCHFAVNLHTELMALDWSPQLLRLGQCKEVIVDTVTIMRGIRARVGAHFVDDIAVALDMFSGSDVWVHDEAAVAFVLAKTAHFGETLYSEEAKERHVRTGSAFNKAVRDATYLDAVGTWSLEQGMAQSNIYQALPIALKQRVPMFLEEDRINADPRAAEKMRAAEERDRRRHERHAKQIALEKPLLAALERNSNPLADPIHRKNARLHQNVKKHLEKDHQRTHTAQATLALLETMSMMCEDPFYIGDAPGNPYHTHLLMHQLEHASLCQSHGFSKAYAASLIDDSKGLGASASASFLGGGGNDNNDVDDDGQDGGSMGEESLSASLRRGGSKRQNKTAAAANGGGSNYANGGIVPEDLVRLHIAVEKFANLISLYGASDRDRTAATAWAQDYADVCPSGYAETLEEQLREMSAQTMAVGMDVGAVDAEEVRRSVIANLSMVMKKLFIDGRDGSPTAVGFAGM